jgi:hypothetical protein
MTTVSDSSTLPTGFESLEAFVPFWCIDGTAARAQRRFESSRDEREAFFAAVKDRQAAALELLDRKPLGILDEKECRLLNLMLSFAHVALAIEVQGPEEERHRQMSRHMVITRSVADR